MRSVHANTTIRANAIFARVNLLPIKQDHKRKPTGAPFRGWIGHPENEPQNTSADVLSESLFPQPTDAADLRS